MKKNVIKSVLIAAVALCTVFALAGCGSSSSSSSSSSSDKTIKVGASPSPHAEILNNVKQTLADEGWTLEVVEYTDYVQPNQALNNKELDANYFQHLPYLNNFNEQNGTQIADAGKIHFETMSIFAGKTASLDALSEGATVGVPSDATNEARALLLLQSNGLITLKAGAGLEATPNDIESNPLNLTFFEAEAASLPSTLADVDIAVINGNYALSAGLDSSLRLATEAADSEAANVYGNIVAVNPDELDSEKTKALMNALTSSASRDFINATYSGTVVPIF